MLNSEFDHFMRTAFKNAIILLISQEFQKFEKYIVEIIFIVKVF